MIGIPAGLAILLVLIVVHELGHLAAARLCNVPVVSFSIGFGRALWERQRGGTTYRLGVVPLGGYIQYSEEPAPAWRIACILLAGPAANLVLGGLLLIAAAAAMDAPAPLMDGIQQTGVFTLEILRGLFAILFSGDFGQLGGPVLISRMAESAAEAGLVPLLLLAAILSLNLAVFNLLPIPVLDGGRALLLLAEALQGRPFKRRVQQVIAMSGLAALVVLSLVALANDVVRLII